MDHKKAKLSVKIGELVCCAEDKMIKCIKYLEDSLVGLRASTMSIGLIQTLKIEYYGSMTPLSELASITQIGKQMNVRVYDSNYLGKINQLLISSGFSSYVHSKDLICINIPQPSGEDREKIKKIVFKLGEETKIAIRNIRRDLRKSAGKEEYDSIEKLSTKYINIVDKLISEKFI